MSNQDPKSKPAPLNRLKTGVFSRSLSLAKLTAQASAGLAAQKMTGFLKKKTARDLAWSDFLKSQASHFSQEIGELKGSLMKAGQMLSVYGEYFFPPEVNQILKTLQNDTPPVQWKKMESILKKEWAPELLEELEIEKEALASASLGQVHRARIKSTGELIVLKIQYPGVERAIDSDLKALKNFLSLIQVFPNSLSLDPLLQELKSMLVQETDYKREVELMELYRSRLQNDSRFIIPKIYSRFCSERVVAMSYERGLRADDPVVQSLNQERRNRLSQNFLELYFKELFEWHLIQTDPHLGNYRLRMDPSGSDQIVLFDFGATKKFEENFLKSYAAMIKATIMKHPEFEKTVMKLGFIEEGDPAELKKIFEDFCHMSVEPFDGSVYDWKKTDLPKRLTDLAIRILRDFPLRTPPHEIVFLDRKTAGVFIFLSVLGARINSRDLILKYLEKIRYE